MTQATDTETGPARPESNIDLARFRKITAAARAARAGSKAMQELVAAERDTLSRLTVSWRGFLSGMNPHKLELADALINPDADPVLREKALDSKVAMRFPYGLADQIRDRRAKLAALEAEAKPAAEKSQVLGTLVDGLTEYLRGLGAVKPDDSAPVLGDGPGGGARPEGLRRFAEQSRQPSIFWRK